MDLGTGGVTMTDYQGKTVTVGNRIELHPACDLWMRGAKYGTVIALDGKCATVKMDHPSVKHNLYVFCEHLRVI